MLYYTFWDSCLCNKINRVEARNIVLVGYLLTCHYLLMRAEGCRETFETDSDEMIGVYRPMVWPILGPHLPYAARYSIHWYTFTSNVASSIGSMNLKGFIPSIRYQRPIRDRRRAPRLGSPRSFRIETPRACSPESSRGKRYKNLSRTMLDKNLD